MPIVRMNTRDADALVEAYDRAATEIGNAIPSLSGLLSQAYELLNMPGQNSVHGPLPALHATKLELTKDSRDLAWRVDWLKNADAQPLGVDGQVQAYAPGEPGPNSTFDLDAALKDAGLTEEEAQRAKAAILRGADFSDAIEDEKQRTFDQNMANFRQMEAEAWSEFEPELTPLEQAESSLDESETSSTPPNTTADEA